MKRLLFIALLLPVLAFAQQEEEKPIKDWEGLKIRDCQEFFLSELISTEGDVHPLIGKGRITENTKTIYIFNQAYLKEAPKNVNGIEIQYIDVDSNLKWLAGEVKKNDAAVFYMSNLHIDPSTCEMYVFPIDVKSGMFGTKMQYNTKSVKMNFFYNYDPPRFHYKGVEVVMLD